MRHGVIVLNDPNGLAKATNKMYFQLFPEEGRPRTVITRDLYADFGDLDVDGLTLSAPDGHHVLFDRVYLGRTQNDFNT